ncbi:MAG: tripartite tricarboxylate transporter substrate binding protein [Comamonas sp.]|nr:tripartite tricarboxylate transporter substrate binding protein [Comamonas sp.]
MICFLPLRRKLLALCSGLLCAAAAMPTSAWAQASGHTFPSKPIKLIVPFAAGGSTDIVARLVADAMQRELGQTVLVENKAGAGGMIGTETVVHAPADGYTLGLGSISSLAVNPVVLKAARVRPLRDLQMVVPLASIASVFSVPPSLGVQDFAQFVATARANGDAWTAGSSGVGSIGHVILEAMNAEWGLQLRHIPFKGMGPVVNSALAGQTQVLSDQFPSSAPHVQAGRLVPFAVAAERRLPSLPDVPTLAELGYPALNDLAITWFGLVAPAGTPAAVVQRLNAAANHALQQSVLRERLAQLGVTPMGGTAQDLQHMVEQTTAQVQMLVRQRGITDGSE